jgi:cell division protein FtsZ
MTEDIVTNRVFDIAFIGAGQGGGRMAEAFFDRGYRKILAINTAPQDLAHLDIPEESKVLASSGIQGAGKDPKVAAAIILEQKDAIRQRIGETFGKCDRIIICIGAGGGTGTGACVPLVGIATEYMASIGHQDPHLKVGVICSSPTDGECRSRAVARNAHRVLHDVFELGHGKKISPIIVVDNNKIRTVFPGLTMREFWPTSNRSVARVFDAFNTLPCQDSPFSSFDPADYQSVMEAGGCMIMGVSSVMDNFDKDSLLAAFEKNMKDTVISDSFSIKTSAAAACIFSCSTDIVDNEPGLMDSVDAALDAMSGRLTGEFIHRGIYEKDSPGIDVYSIVGGLAYQHALLKKLKRASS